jgi:GxxExxY protein
MSEDTLLERSTTAAIIGAFYEVYNNIGYGFLENAYSMALERELASRGHSVKREFTITLSYKGESLTTHRLDMVVDDRVVIELKSTAALPPFARRQTLSYLRASGLEVGLILHFGPQARFYRIVHTRARSGSEESSGALRG